MGDPDFDRLWTEHHPRVHAYALRRTDAATAQDVVAETFLVAWRRRSEVPSEPVPWLLGVARLVLANQWRGEQRRRALEGVLVEATRRHRPEEAPDVPILAALASLDVGDREVLLLTAWDGLSAAEAGTVLDCSTGAVWMRLQRARRRLAVALDAASTTTADEGAPSR